MIVPCKYDSAMYWPYCALAPVMHRARFGLVNRQGKLVAPCKYDEVGGAFNQTGWYAVWVKLKGKKIYLDDKGRKATRKKLSKSPTGGGDYWENDNVHLCWEGYETREDGKVGYRIDPDFIPCIYDTIKHLFLPDPNERLLCPSRFIVYVGGKCGIISNKNEVVAPIEYDGIKMVDAGKMGRYYFIVTRNGLQGIMNEKGALLTPFIYTNLSLECIEINGKEVLYFIGQKNGLGGLLNDAGKELTAFRYKEMDVWYNPLIKVIMANGKWGYLGINGVEYFEE